MPVMLGSFRRLRDELGWEPKIPIEETLNDLLDHWRGESSRLA
jgi:nucleoside-diphosphate-sugar epimerase